MRPIDADAFKEYLEQVLEESKPLFKTDEFRIIATRIIEEIINDLDNQPTI